MNLTNRLEQKTTRNKLLIHSPWRGTWKISWNFSECCFSLRLLRFTESRSAMNDAIFNYNPNNIAADSDLLLLLKINTNLEEELQKSNIAWIYTFSALMWAFKYWRNWRRFTITWTYSTDCDVIYQMNSRESLLSWFLIPSKIVSVPKLWSFMNTSTSYIRTNRNPHLCIPKKWFKNSAISYALNNFQWH